MLRKRLHSPLLGLLLAAAALAGSCAPAAAGTYDVHSCGASSTSTAGWSYEATAGESGGTPYFYATSNCSSFGVYRRFEVNTVAAGAYSAWTFAAPAGTWISSAALTQSIIPRSPGAYDAVYADLENGNRSNVASYIGNTGTTQGNATYALPQTGSHAIRFRTELGCQQGGNCSGLSNNQYGNEWTLSGATMHLVDPSTPVFGSVGGSGWNAAPADGVAPITYDVTDSGSGVSQVHFLVDGVDHGVNSSTCTAGSLVPCPLSGSGQFALDTTELAEGSHTIALTSSDYSGNATSPASKQLTISVRRAPQASATTPVSTSDPSWNGGGSPAVGDHLAGSTGSWSGSDNSYAYQWLRCDSQGLNCVLIDGANAIGYTPTAQDIGHTLQFCVRATNSGGSATSCSAPTPVVIASHPAPADGSHDSATPATPINAGAPHPVVPSGSTATVDRGAPNGSPAADRVVLTALANSRSSSMKVKYGKRVPITGRLVGPSGAPIAGALLAVQVQTAIPGASMADAAQVVTGADGRFTYTAPAGPSRTVRFGYRTYTADTSFADTTDVHLLVSAGVTMKATLKTVHNKHATVFKGRLLGKPIAKRGVVVDLQVFFRKQWRTFAAPRTNKAGAYKFKYRFMAGKATWRFRARVRKDSSYPYEIGYSTKAVKVRVLP